MKALLSKSVGGPDTLVLEDLPDPTPGPGQVRLAVKACGVNYPDLLIIEDKYQFKPERPFAPGGEVSGVVEAVGPGVKRLKVSDRVIGSCGWGGMATKLVLEEERCIPFPDAMPFEVASALILTYGTTIHALKDRAKLQNGETLLVLGAAGGVGLAGVQLGKALGACVLAAASSADKLEAAMRQGAEGTIDYSSERVEDGVMRLTSGKGVDVVLDPVGIAQESALRCLAHDGRLLIAGFAGGAIPAYAANRILLKGASVIGVRAGEAGRQDPAMREGELRELRDLADRGLARPYVSARFPLEGFEDAMRLLQERRAIGRIALEMGSG